MEQQRTQDMENHDLRARVVQLEQHHQEKVQRLTALEQWRIATDLAMVRKDEQFGVIKEDIKTIKSTMSRIMWLIIGGIISGLVAFMMSGGFKIPH